MASGTADPKGYYRILGVAPDADAAAVKTAYRSRAKDLHPDHNPSAHAGEAFARLNEAYQVISDPRRRAAYDRLAARVHAAFTSGPRTQAQARPQPEARPKAAQPPPRPQAQSQPRRTERPASGETLCPCSRCGKVTAQPRHIIFRRVIGRLRHTLITPIEGTFCRRCAQVTAVKASYATLVSGWWALPRGPLETLRALWINVRGGEIPAEANRALLVAQARAFLGRGEAALARGCAEQAYDFVRDGADRREVEHLLGLIPRGTRRLRDRWRSPGWAAPVQLLPLGLVIAVVVTMLPGLGDGSPADQAATAAAGSDTVRRPEVLRPDVGRLNVIASERLAVRSGPSVAYRVSATLDKGSTVLVNELSPDGKWARILTAEGVSGFVEAEGLRRRTSGAP